MEGAGGGVALLSEHTKAQGQERQKQKTAKSAKTAAKSAKTAANTKQ